MLLLQKYAHKKHILLFRRVFAKKDMIYICNAKPINKVWESPTPKKNGDAFGNYFNINDGIKVKGKRWISDKKPPHGTKTGTGTNTELVTEFQNGVFFIVVVTPKTQKNVSTLSTRSFVGSIYVNAQRTLPASGEVLTRAAL